MHISGELHHRPETEDKSTAGESTSVAPREHSRVNCDYNRCVMQCWAGFSGQRGVKENEGHYSTASGPNRKLHCAFLIHTY